MRSRRAREVFTVLLSLAFLGLSARGARADRMYSIQDLGTLPGTSQSIATGINASGQVTGISYSSTDGTWKDVGVRSSLGLSYDAGAKSFLYSNGQMTQINPVDGPANAINASGQVVGGHYSSVNDSGQYVGSSGSGLVFQNQYSLPSQLVSGGMTTNPPLQPMAINNSGQIAGFIGVQGDAGSYSAHAAFYRNGITSDLSRPFGLNGVDDKVTALSASGSAIIAEGLMGGASPVHYWLYNPTGYHFNGDTGPNVTDLTNLPGGLGKAALGLNSLNQVVGNGFLYSDGAFASLQSMLPVPAASQWSKLNATGINDAGQIVGQGLINGQEHAFLMTLTDNQVPEPSMLLIFALASTGYFLRASARRSRPRQED
jgi:probable HAF family extracellular repeat protein